MVAYLVRRAAGDQAAVDQGRYPVGEAEHGIHVVLDQQDGPPALERFDEAEDTLGFVGSHPGHRLVEQQDARAGRQSQAELELPALAVRQYAGQLIAAVTQSDGVELDAGALAVVRTAGAPE